MGFLLGLPLKRLALVVGLLRVLIPVLLLIWGTRRRWRKYGGHRRSESAKKDEPHFKGPVYTVDYKEVKDDDRHKE